MIRMLVEAGADVNEICGWGTCCTLLLRQAG